MGKPITQDLIIQKSKISNLKQVKNLNLWGQEIDDVQIVEQLPNIEVLSLSVNKIVTLRHFSQCMLLQELYLRQNCIKNLLEIKYLMDLPNLKILWLNDNPLTETPNYKMKVIRALPRLIMLDNQQIKSEERTTAQALNLNNFLKFLKLYNTKDWNEFEYQLDQQREQGKDVEQPIKQEQVIVQQNTTQEENQFNNQQSYDNEQLQQQYINQYYQNQQNNNDGDDDSNENQIQQNEEEDEKAQQETSQKITDKDLSLKRNENLVCAVFAILNELDGLSLELVKKEVDRKLGQ